MEAPLQQRIVGAIVLVTLGVIFIPALLDGSGYKSRQVQDIRVKAKPEFAPLQQKKLKPIATPIDKHNTSNKASNKVVAKTADNQASGKASAQVNQHVDKHVGKKQIKSFALQVGTFDTYERAEIHRDKLRKSGYRTYIHKSKSKSKTSFKVRIGPELEYSALERVKAKIKKTHKIKAFIVNHP